MKRYLLLARVIANLSGVRDPETFVYVREYSVIVLAIAGRTRSRSVVVVRERGVYRGDTARSAVQ